MRGMHTAEGADWVRKVASEYVGIGMYEKYRLQKVWSTHRKEHLGMLAPMCLGRVYWGTCGVGEESSV